MRRVVALLMLAVSLLGCGALPWDQAVLLTRAKDDDPNLGCVLMGVFGELVTDPVSGTAMVGERDRYPVSWPRGYTARRAGSEVQVLDRLGRVVATTGNQYELYYRWESKLYEGKPGTTLLACGEVRALAPSAPGAGNT